jgi:hypothetical protein
MNATELADELENTYPFVGVMEIAATMLRQQQERLTKYELRHEEQRKRIDELEAYQKHDVELAEAIGWDKGYEAGRQLGMKQERALWELAASTQEIMDTHPVKEQDESFDRTASHMAGEYVSYKAELTDEEINVVAILQDAEIVPVGHEIWKTNEEFNKYKRIVLATAKALRKAQE